MPEEQAFSVLVKIMFDYGLRELFKQNFEDLHCKFYQLERLMQVKKETILPLPLRAQSGERWVDEMVPRSSGVALAIRVKDRRFCLFFMTWWWWWCQGVSLMVVSWVFSVIKHTEYQKTVGPLTQHTQSGNIRQNTGADWLGISEQSETNFQTAFPLICHHFGDFSLELACGLDKGA